MSLSLTKGQSLDLSKVATDAGAALKELVAGAGWDAKENGKVDLDLFAVYLGDDGKAIADANGNGTNADEALTFFSNAKNNSGGNPPVAGALHSGDNRTGEGDGDDETITFTLADVPAEAKSIAIAAAIYEGADNLGEVENVSVRLVNTDGDTELAKYSTTDLDATAQGVYLGVVARDGDNWKFTAKGEALKGTFAEIVKSFGVTGL